MISTALKEVKYIHIGVINIEFSRNAVSAVKLSFQNIACLIIVSKFLPCDARAKRGIAIVSRPSVRNVVRNVDVPWAYRLE